MTEKSSRAENLLSEMSAIIKDELGNHAIPNAGEVAGKVVSVIARHLGGQQVYLPRGQAGERLARDVAIRQEHDGSVAGPHGVESLARKWQLSEVSIWRILASGRKQ